MTDKITYLQSIPSAPNADKQALSSSLRNFLKDHEILEEWDETDLDLEGPNSDEQKVGSLNAFERENYVVGQLVQQVLRETMIDLEANSTHQIAKIMREQRLSMAAAAEIFREQAAEYLPEEDQAFLNQCALTIGYSLTTYEWSIRRRYNVWRGQLIVRSGYCCYVYG